MGKNKAKAAFNEQRRLMASLMATEERLASDAAAIFSVSPIETDSSHSTDVPEYSLFLVAVQDLQNSPDKSKGLTELWKRAYGLGKQDGQGIDPIEAATREDEIQEVSGKAWQEGYDLGADTGLKDGYEKGFHEGVAKTEEVFVGHVSLGECFAGRKLRTDVSVATEPLPITPSSLPSLPGPIVDDSESITDYQSVADENTPRNWADDPDLIPVHQISSKQPPRDLSALRTPNVKKPFSSLQRRLKNTDKMRPCDSQTIYLRDTSQPKSPTVPKKPQSRKRNVETQTAGPSKTTPGLDWTRDPRLAQLARALQDLGWIFPMKFS